MMGHTIQFTPAILDHLMPMHVLVSGTGHIVSTGPTLAKLWPHQPLPGQRLLEVFHMRRPTLLKSTMDELRHVSPCPVVLETRDTRSTRLKGAMFQLGGGNDIFLNLSFGISAMKAVREYGLTNGDFAPTDLTIEMLYLREAKAAITTELHKLAARLAGSLDAAQNDAETDPLTGLGNRRAMERRFDQLVQAGRDFALFQLDLDFFKIINDRLGHAAGDHVLLEVSQRLKKTIRATDLVARIGGDEFVMLLDGMSDPNRVDALAAELIGQIERPIHWGAEVCRVSGSVGYTLSHYYEAQTLSVMVDDADQALYCAKDKGKGRAIAYMPQHIRM